jgi:hypothetical protein
MAGALPVLGALPKVTMQKEFSMKAKKHDLPEAQLVSNLVTDPANVPNMSLRLGIIGKSHREGHVRLYTTPQLDQFLDVREEDIVHSEQLASQSNVFQGTALWIKPEAVVTTTRTSLQRSAGDFLSGDIVQGYLSDTIGATQPLLGTWTTIFSTLACVVIVSMVCSLNCKPTMGGEASVCLCVKR